MRQAGLEAARKASDARTKALQTSARTPTKISEQTIQNLNNSAPSGMPPPSGTTEAKSAMAPETTTAGTSVESDADRVPITNEKTAQPKGSNNDNNNAKSQDPDLEAVVPESKDRIEVESDNDEPSSSDEAPDPDTEAVVPDSKTVIPTKSEPEGDQDQASDAKTLSGTKIQDQAAADGKEAGVSNAD